MVKMITDKTMLFLYVETPLHAGVGTGLSSIDLPIQRERTTQYPMIQGSGIKGKLRATAEFARDRGQFFQEDINVLFGPPTGGGDDFAGALIAGDARILLFPVRSLSGVFAYTTSYDVLSRFERDIERGQTEQKLSWKVPNSNKDQVLITTTSDIQANNTVVLEEFSYEAQPDKQVDAIAQWLTEKALPELGMGDYWANKVKNSLVILPDNDFRDFALYSTEVITRVRIDRTKKTVEKGALWTEEHLPTDTLLYVPMYATDARKNGKDGSKLKGTQIIEKAKGLGTGTSNYLQLGGDETLGRGIVRIRWGS
jgi:CRISPR-associated protein Cmr4